MFKISIKLSSIVDTARFGPTVTDQQSGQVATSKQFNSQLDDSVGLTGCRMEEIFLLLRCCLSLSKLICSFQWSLESNPPLIAVRGSLSTQAKKRFPLKSSS